MRLVHRIVLALAATTSLIVAACSDDPGATAPTTDAETTSPATTPASTIATTWPDASSPSSGTIVVSFEPVGPGAEAIVIDPVTGGAGIVDWNRPDATRWAISPDGTRVAIATTGVGLEILDAISSEVVWTGFAGSEVGALSWSTGGTMLAVSVERGDGTMELAVVDPSGGSPRAIAAFPTWFDPPRWSPDDTLLAYGQRAETVEVASGEPTDARLTDPTSGGPTDAIPLLRAWSPDGRLHAARATIDGASAVVVHTADDSASRVIWTGTPTPGVMPPADVQAAWAPTSDRLVVAHRGTLTIVPVGEGPTASILDVGERIVAGIDWVAATVPGAPIAPDETATPGPATVVALDLRTGTTAWATEIPGGTGYGVFTGPTPSVDTGSSGLTVAEGDLVDGEGRSVVAVDDATGEIRWTAAVTTADRIDANGETIVVWSTQGDLHGVRADTGELVWTQPIGEPLPGAHLATTTERVVSAPSTTARLTSRDRSTGEELATVQLDELSLVTGLGAEGVTTAVGTAAWPSNIGTVRLLDTDTLATTWSVQLRDVQSVAVALDAQRVYAVLAPSTARADDETEVVAFDRADGDELWRRSLPLVTWTDLACGEALVLTGWTGTVALDVETGEIRWDAGGGTAVAIAGDAVVLTGLPQPDRTTTTVLAIDDGATRWEHDWIAPDTGSGRPVGVGDGLVTSVLAGG